MRIADREIGPGHPVFIVAEVSCNHMGRLDYAHQLMDAAKAIGADAVKFQCYTPEEMTLPPSETGADPRFILQSGPWAGRHLWDLYTEAQTPRAWFPELFAHAWQVGIIPFSSVFSLDGVAFLESIACPAYKIATSEAGWEDLQRKVHMTGKPMLVSNPAGPSADYIALHCIPEYPAAIEGAGLGRLSRWANLGLVGLSDHHLNSLPALLALGAGAVVFEKHLMLDGTVPLDTGHSLAPDGFAHYVHVLREAERCLPMGPRAENPFKRRLVDGRWIRCGP